MSSSQINNLIQTHIVFSFFKQFQRDEILSLQTNNLIQTHVVFSLFKQFQLNLNSISIINSKFQNYNFQYNHIEFQTCIFELSTQNAIEKNRFNDEFINNIALNFSQHRVLIEKTTQLLINSIDDAKIHESKLKRKRISNEVNRVVDARLRTLISKYKIKMFKKVSKQQRNLN